MSYPRLQQVTVSEYGNKSLSNKTLADSFYNDQLSCLISSPGWLLVTLVHGTQWHHQSEHWRSGPWKPCKVSAQKNIIVKAGTHSHIYSHIQTELNISKIENSPIVEYKHLTALSTGSKKSSVWPPKSRVCSAVALHRQSTPDTFWARQCWKK